MARRYIFAYGAGAADNEIRTLILFPILSMLEYIRCVAKYSKIRELVIARSGFDKESEEYSNFSCN